MRFSFAGLLAVGCTASVAEPPSVVLGEEIELSRPNNGLHHHATTAWLDDRLAVAWTTGFEPVTGAWFRMFDAAGQSNMPPAQLNSVREFGDKPDVAPFDGGLVTAFDDRVDGVWLRGVSANGALRGADVALHTAVGFEVDAVDLALRPDGSGIAIWTECCAEWMEPDDGRIVFRAFDANLQPDGPPRVVEQSSRKTSDAVPLPDGGFVAVWARHHDHPTLADETLYEVHGRIYGADGSTRSFRADDLDNAWPSRPAVAVHPDDQRIAVSWRDKTSSRGDHAGAYGRLFSAEGQAVGPSVPLGPGGNGNRVVTAWAGPYAVFAWEEDAEDGLAAVWMSVLDGETAEVLVDRQEVSEPGGLRDGRPTILVREVAEAFEVQFVWETLRATSDVGEGLRGRTVTLSGPGG